MSTKRKHQVQATAKPVGMPVAWPDLIQESGTDAGLAVDLLKNIDNNKGQRRIKDIVRHHLQQIPGVLASCPHLTFVFVSWDDEQFSLIQRAGPNRRSVSRLLCQPGLRRSRCKRSSDNECEAVWNAVETITEEIERQNKFRFVLLSRLDDDRLAELSHSGDFTRQEAWQAIRDSVPIEFRESVPTEPPPNRLELEKTLIEPAPPSGAVSDSAAFYGNWSEFQRHNFDRPIDWRWDRSWAIIQNRRYCSRKRDDEETRRAVHFLRGLLRQHDTLVPFTGMPAMMTAHRIWKEGGDRRLELESRILARQSSPEIAYSMEISDDAVDMYADTFFDVRGRLGSRTYITKKVIGTQWATSLNPRVGLFRSIAFFGGVGMLEAVLPYFRDNGQLLNELTGDETVQDPFATRLDLLLRARSMPDDEKTALRMASIYPELMSDLTTGSQESFIGLLSKIVPPMPQDVEPAVQKTKPVPDTDDAAA